MLDGVDLEVTAGSFVAVLGHNGSGKSTLAKHMNAILLPTGGKVYVDGIDTADEARLLDIRRTVGMVFQNPDNQIVASVVEEDVAFAPENLGVPSEEIRRRVDDALKAVGLTVPETVELCWELRQDGLDLPLDALTDEECAQALCRLLTEEGGTR